MPLSPQERAELEALKAEQAQGPQGDPQDTPPDALGSPGLAALQGFGNRASFGNLASLQAKAEPYIQGGLEKLFGKHSDVDAQVLQQLGPGASITSSQAAPDQYWQERQAGLEESNPTASMAGGLAGDVVSGLATGGAVAGAGKAAGAAGLGRVASALSRPGVAAAVEGGVSGALDPEGSAIGGAAGGSLMHGAGQLVSKGLKAGGGVARDVRQFSDLAGSETKAKDLLRKTKGDIMELGRPSREAKAALLERSAAVPEFGNTGKMIPAREAEKLRAARMAEGKDLRKSLARGNYVEGGSEKAARFAEEGRHYGDAINQDPLIAQINPQLSRDAALSGRLGSLEENTLEKLLANKPSTQAALQRAASPEYIGYGKDLKALSDTLRRGKQYSLGVGDIKNPLAGVSKLGVRGASELAEAGSQGVEKVAAADVTGGLGKALGISETQLSDLPLRNILLNLSRRKQEEQE